LVAAVEQQAIQDLSVKGLPGKEAGSESSPEGS